MILYAIFRDTRLRHAKLWLKWFEDLIYDVVENNVVGKHSGAFYAATKAWQRANRPKVYYSFVMTAGRFRKLMPKQMYLVLRGRRLYSLIELVNTIS